MTIQKKLRAEVRAEAEAAGDALYEWLLLTNPNTCERAACQRFVSHFLREAEANRAGDVTALTAIPFFTTDPMHPGDSALVRAASLTVPRPIWSRYLAALRDCEVYFGMRLPPFVADYKRLANSATRTT